MLTAIIPIVNHHLLGPAWRRIREIPPTDIKHLKFHKKSLTYDIISCYTDSKPYCVQILSALFVPGTRVLSKMGLELTYKELKHHETPKNYRHLNSLELTYKELKL
jgi:hypothetical protein